MRKILMLPLKEYSMTEMGSCIKRLAHRVWDTISPRAAMYHVTQVVHCPCVLIQEVGKNPPCILIIKLYRLEQVVTSWQEGKSFLIFTRPPPLAPPASI